MSDKNRYDELLESLLNIGQKGVNFLMVEQTLGIPKSEVYEMMSRINSHDKTFISTNTSSFGINDIDRHRVRVFLDSGGFYKIDNNKRIEDESRDLSLQLTREQLKNIKQTRVFAIIGCVTGILTLLWKVIELIVKVE